MSLQISNKNYSPVQFKGMSKSEKTVNENDLVNKEERAQKRQKEIALNLMGFSAFMAFGLTGLGIQKYFPKYIRHFNTLPIIAAIVGLGYMITSDIMGKKTNKQK